MDINNDTTTLGLDSSQSQNVDPQTLVSTDELTAIVASHEKLQRWNDAAELALATDAKLEDTTLIQNIRNTAALIASSGRSVSSQNFELMRAMNISDSTLSLSALAKGFAEGTLDEMMLPVRRLAELQQPGDMNPEHAKKRAEALENSIMQIGSQALDVAATATHHAKSAWEHPENIANSLSNTARGAYVSVQSHVDQLPITIASGLMDKNAEQALGFSFGVATVGMLRNTAASSGRLMRDLSEKMDFSPMGNTGRVSKVEYKPDNEHFISGFVIGGTLRYEIKKSDGDRWGHGNEMLASMIDKFKKNGIEIERLQGAMMTEGPSSSIGRQYLNAIAVGHTKEEAAFMTLTGQHAKAMGMNHVIVPPMAPMDKSLHPLFSKEPPVPKPDDQRSSLDSPTDKDVIVGQLKSLGLPPEKEQMVIAHVEKRFDIQSRDDSLSA